MVIYLAGGIAGNCKPQWQEMIKALYGDEEKLDLYLAGTQGRRWCVDVYLAGIQGRTKGFVLDDQLKDINKVDIAILESFFYADEWTEKIIPLLDRFLLDSGAFTFMNSEKDKSKVNFDEYLTKYINFINNNNVKYFFELDIDSIVGYDEVLKLRERLERETRKKCIPVWHKSRGLDEWVKLTKEYDYIAIGGIVTKEIKRTEYKYFTKLLKIAKENNCKVHGLGFTNLKGLEKYKFYSVDSTSWTTGNRFGSVYKFDGRTMVKYHKQEGQRLSNAREVAIHNFNEWVKFQKYAKKFL